MRKNAVAALSLGLVAIAARAEESARLDHVLLVSVDGLHALDVANYAAAHPDSALAQLVNHGLTYSNARTPANSDSFPGLLALVSGGSPNSLGLFYDVSFNRGIFDPANTTCSGQPGNLQVYDESIDPATPDLIVQPIYGTIYTGSSKKNAEHGGFSFGDTNVGLVVSNPRLSRRAIKSPVATSQVAASIVKALGLDPGALDAVRQEGTQILPFLFGE